MITRSGTRSLAVFTATTAPTTGRQPNKPVAIRARAALRRIDSDPGTSAVTAETLLRRRNALPEDHPDRKTIRIRVIEDNLSMAHGLARRYCGRGETYDDLAQAAALALIKAVDGYDPRREVPFAGYAIPTIIGSLKRHFRDTSWAIRVSRSAQELGRKVGDATDQLSQQLGHMPTRGEVASHLHVAVGDVEAATTARNAYRLTSLDTFPTTDHGAVDLASRLGAADPAYEHIDNTLSLRPSVAALPPRLRRILTLRFADELTQSQIATEIGLSQMHVSRLLKQALQLLHIELTAH
jgi:RNA polymerase sigma-B factor